MIIKYSPVDTGLIYKLALKYGLRPRPISSDTSRVTHTPYSDHRSEMSFLVELMDKRLIKIVSFE